MKTIQLTRGLVALVDDEDFEVLSAFKWFAVKGKHTFYAVRTINVSKTHKSREAMHRVILTATEEMFVDHRNGNGLDNQRENLRSCTNQQNSQNGAPRGGSSRFKGVSWHKVTSKWSASIRKDGRSKHLGLFTTEEAAARAYDQAARTSFGEFARLNFSGVES